LGDGDGEAVAWGWAKQKVANARTSNAARGRCLFMLSLLGFEVFSFDSGTRFYYYGKETVNRFACVRTGSVNTVVFESAGERG
jgi:hypothetical protein